MKPPFRADHVGSLLRPKTLHEAREKRAKGAIPQEALTEAEDKAISDAVRKQEAIGLRSVTDGEFRRTMWHMDFITRFANVAVVPSEIKIRFHTHEGDIDV